MCFFPIFRSSSDLIFLEAESITGDEFLWIGLYLLEFRLCKFWDRIVSFRSSSRRILSPLFFCWFTRAFCSCHGFRKGHQSWDWSRPVPGDRGTAASACAPLAAAYSLTPSCVRRFWAQRVSASLSLPHCVRPFLRLLCVRGEQHQALRAVCVQHQVENFDSRCEWAGPDLALDLALWPQGQFARPRAAPKFPMPLALLAQWVPWGRPKNIFSLFVIVHLNK
jgi:hypothetical protein